MSNREFSINSNQELTLMAESTCSAFDCEFVALASDLDIQLVTFDKKFFLNFLQLRFILMISWLINLLFFCDIIPR